jgi:hypothetical protein
MAGRSAPSMSHPRAGPRALTARKHYEPPRATAARGGDPGVSAADFCARSRAAWPLLRVAPNGSARSTDSPPTGSSASGNPRLRDYGRRADASGAPARETRTRGKRHDPAAPSGELESPASAALAPVWLPPDWRGLDAPRQLVLGADRARSDDVAHSCGRCAQSEKDRPPVARLLPLSTPLIDPCRERSCSVTINYTLHEYLRRPVRLLRQSIYQLWA